MKYLFLAVLAVSVFGFTLNLNGGKENENDYFIVHLEDDDYMNCETKFQNEQKIYVCYVNSELSNAPTDQNLPFMQLYFRELSKSKFAVVIVPKLKSVLLNLDKKLFDDKEVLLRDSNKSRHYAVLIDEKFDKFEPKSVIGLNFPIIFKDLMRPKVGALDFNKEPLTFEKNGDVGIYLGIKKNYDKKLYSDALKAAKNAITTQSGSVFANEFWLYYIKSLDKIALETKDYKQAGKYAAELIAAAKVWMKNFASDKNYPEVLFLLTRSYLNLDQESDANYTLDILSTEHAGSIWTQKATLIYGDVLFVKGQTEDALRLYSDVLYQAKDKDVASQAAMKLSSISFKTNKPADGANYARKVISANKEYLINNAEEALNSAANLAEFGYDADAKKIYEIILNSAPPKTEEYEISLRHLALLSPSDPQESYDYLQRYQNEFKGSEYLSLMSAATDKIFFELKTDDPQKLHENYLNLMEKHGANEIGKKAFLEEIKLSYKEKNYAHVLDLAGKFDDNDSAAYVNLSALNLANLANQKGECGRVVELAQKYELDEQITDKNKLYSCYMRTGKFEKALQIAQPLTSTHDLHDKVEWLANASKSLFALGRYELCVKACDEALAIAVKTTNADPTEAIFYRFYSLLFLDKFADALSSIKALEDLRGTDNKLAEAYNATAKYAAAHGFDAPALNYAKKTIEMQNRLKISTFSPEIELLYMDSLNKFAKFDDALEVIKTLLDMNLTHEQKARALYNASEIYLKKGDTQSAAQYSRECVKIDENSPWKDLCKEQNKFLGTNYF